MLREMGGDVVWQQTFVTADRMYCVYIAPSEARIREHADARRLSRRHDRAGDPSDRPGDGLAR